MYLSSKQFNKLFFLVVFKPFLEDSYKLCEKGVYNSVPDMHRNCCLETVVGFFCGPSSRRDPLKQKSLISLGEEADSVNHLK